MKWAAGQRILERVEKRADAAVAAARAVGGRQRQNTHEHPLELVRVVDEMPTRPAVAAAVQWMVHDPPPGNVDAIDVPEEVWKVWKVWKVWMVWSV